MDPKGSRAPLGKRGGASEGLSPQSAVPAATQHRLASPRALPRRPGAQAEAGAPGWAGRLSPYGMGAGEGRAPG